MFLCIEWVDTCPEIPDWVEILHVKRTTFLTLGKLPTGLKQLSVFHNPVMRNLPELPPNLERLRLCDLPALETLPSIPPSVYSVDLQSLNITDPPHMTRGHLYLERMPKLRTIPNPDIVETSPYVCPELELQQRDGEMRDAYMARWAQHLRAKI